MVHRHREVIINSIQLNSDPTKFVEERLNTLIEGEVCVKKYVSFKRHPRCGIGRLGTRTLLRNAVVRFRSHRHTCIKGKHIINKLKNIISKHLI